MVNTDMLLPLPDSSLVAQMEHFGVAVRSLGVALSLKGLT